MKTLKKLDMENVAEAIEADAGEALPGLRDSMAEAKAGKFAEIRTSAKIAKRRWRPVGSTQAVTKEAVKLHLEADVLEALRASGDGWQTRTNDMLRASLALAEKVPAMR